MKRMLYVIAIASLIMMSCSGSSKEEAKAKQEIMANDSLANEAEKSAADIQQSVNEVDSLVNEL
ncbi:MAG TPA: hypothetical protein PK784_15040 [Tenuifilaceae bacterium]|nr:hypothetical protein [Tenuifilaceae bacterium]HPN20576.1 hypothetical protein [Tenuifilaceae bacterium]HPV55716.1 hypothetical protein [Tenuifilaceae bacterium]